MPSPQGWWRQSSLKLLAPSARATAEVLAITWLLLMGNGVTVPVSPSCDALLTPTRFLGRRRAGGFSSGRRNGKKPPPCPGGSSAQASWLSQKQPEPTVGVVRGGGCLRRTGAGVLALSPLESLCSLPFRWQNLAGVECHRAAGHGPRGNSVLAPLCGTSSHQDPSLLPLPLCWQLGCSSRASVSPYG